MRDDHPGIVARDQFLDALLDRLRGRRGLDEFVRQAEQVVGVIRDAERGNASKPLEVVAPEHIEAFRRRSPKDKAIDPEAKRRVLAYKRAELHFRTWETELRERDGVARPSAEQWEQVIQELWWDDIREAGRDRSTFRQPEAAPASLVAEVQEARTPRARALRLAHAAWGNPQTEPEDYGRVLDRIWKKIGPFS